MAVLEGRGVDGVLGVGTPEHEIGVTTDGDGALATGEPGKARRRRAHPLDDVTHAVTTRLRGGPDGGEADLQGRDPAPGLHEVAGARALHLRRGRRVVGDHLVDEALAERIPQLLAVVRLADGRRALEGGGAVRDLLGGEREVVRARLDGERYARVAGAAEGGERIRRGEMNDVRARAGLLRDAQHEIDGGVLGGARARRQVRVVATRVEAERGLLALGERLGELGVHEQRRAEARDLGHAGAELGLVYVRELGDAALGEEALEGQHAFLEEVAQAAVRTGVAGNEPAAQRDVDAGLLLERAHLGAEAFERGGRRHAVERHVDEGGDAARGRRAGRGGEALPLGAARLVDVDVRVDEAGQDAEIARVEDGEAGGAVVVVGDGDDDAAGDMNGVRRLADGRDDAFAADDRIDRHLGGQSSPSQGASSDRTRASRSQSGSHRRDGHVDREQRVAEERVSEPRVRGDRAAEVAGPENGAEGRGPGHDVERQARELDEPDPQECARGEAEVCGRLHGRLEAKELEGRIEEQKCEDQPREDAGGPPAARARGGRGLGEGESGGAIQHERSSIGRSADRQRGAIFFRPRDPPGNVLYTDARC